MRIHFGRPIHNIKHYFHKRLLSFLTKTLYYFITKGDKQGRSTTTTIYTEDALNRRGGCGTKHLPGPDLWFPVKAISFYIKYRVFEKFENRRYLI